MELAIGIWTLAAIIGVFLFALNRTIKQAQKSQ